MASFWARLSMERAQQEVLIKQTLCANLNTYIFCLILLVQRAEPSHYRRQCVNIGKVSYCVFPPS